MDSVQYELVSETGQEVQVGARLLCRGVQQQGPGCQVTVEQSKKLIIHNSFLSLELFIDAKTYQPGRRHLRIHSEVNL